MSTCVKITRKSTSSTAPSKTYQFTDLVFQVLDTVQLPLAASLGSDAVFAAAADVVDELQLL